MGNEIKKHPGIELLFDKLKAAGNFKGFKNYADYAAKRNLEQVHDPQVSESILLGVSTSGKKQRPMFGYSD